MRAPSPAGSRRLRSRAGERAKIFFGCSFAFTTAIAQLSTPRARFHWRTARHRISVLLCRALAAPYGQQTLPPKDTECDSLYAINAGQRKLFHRLFINLLRTRHSSGQTASAQPFARSQYALCASSVRLVASVASQAVIQRYPELVKSFIGITDDKAHPQKTLCVITPAQSS